MFVATSIVFFVAKFGPSVVLLDLVVLDFVILTVRIDPWMVLQ